MSARRTSSSHRIPFTTTDAAASSLAAVEDTTRTSRADACDAFQVRDDSVDLVCGSDVAVAMDVGNAV